MGPGARASSRRKRSIEMIITPSYSICSPPPMLGALRRDWQRKGSEELPNDLGRARTEPRLWEGGAVPDGEFEIVEVFGEEGRLDAFYGFVGRISRAMGAQLHGPSQQVNCDRRQFF